MASLIPGFEYDIFISYRQKDNKYDGWVTDFVSNLKKELEAAFKDDINVYFDINPHDGLLQTHDVNDSLKEKLKCLVFIPVISRTYCDSKSFAWEHEFKVFIDYASQDRFGLKIKLPNGNVASRVLPIRIYDLDLEDVKLCESVLGGPIRGIDFVYREAGINRPLTPEDNELKNLENTRYRNQVNKTGNAIKEIISGLKSGQGSTSKERPDYRDVWEEKTTRKNKEKTTGVIFSGRSLKWLIMFILPVIIIFAAVSFYLFINQNPVHKTIAILFSSDIKNDTSLKYIGDIYAETIHSKIKAIKRINVRPRINMLQYRETEKSLNTIRKELSVDFLLYGNIKRDGNEVDIWITLISEKADKELWSNEYTWDKSLISKNSSEIVRTIAGYLKAGLSPEELDRIESNPSKNAEANLNYTFANAISYDAWSSYAMGNRLMESISFTSALNSYDKAIENDSLFAEAYAKRAISRSWGYYTGQLDSTQIKKCRDDIYKALEINKNLPDVHNALGFYYYYCKGEFDKALEHFSIAAKQDPEDYEPLFYMAMVYRRMGDWNKSQNLIRKVIGLDPQEALYLTNIGISYAYLHDYDSAMIFYKKAINIMPAWPDAYNNMIDALILKNGNIKEARKILNNAIQNTKDNFSEVKIQLSVYEKKYDDALREAERSNFNDFGYKGDKYLYMAMINSYLNKQSESAICFDSAIVNFKRELAADSCASLIHSSLGIAYAGKGIKGKAIMEIEKTRDCFKPDIWNKSHEIINLAQIYTMTGEYDQALSSIEYLLKTPSLFSLEQIQLDPVWKPLMDLKEFKKLIAKYPSD